MTSACDAARTAIVAGSDVSVHVAACAECRAFAARVARVDRSLAVAARDAASSKLPPALRATIVAGSRRAAAAAPPPRGRLLDLALRAAAVAAVLVGGAWLIPQPLLADDAVLADLQIPSMGLSEAITARISTLPRLADTEPPDVPGGPAPMAIAAAAFLGGAWFVTRSRRPG